MDIIIYNDACVYVSEKAEYSFLFFFKLSAIIVGINNYNTVFVLKRFRR